MTVDLCENSVLTICVERKLLKMSRFQPKVLRFEDEQESKGVVKPSKIVNYNQKW